MPNRTQTVVQTSCLYIIRMCLEIWVNKITTNSPGLFVTTLLAKMASIQYTVLPTFRHPYLSVLYRMADWKGRFSQDFSSLSSMPWLHDNLTWKVGNRVDMGQKWGRTQTLYVLFCVHISFSGSGPVIFSRNQMMIPYSARYLTDNSIYNHIHIFYKMMCHFNGMINIDLCGPGLGVLLGAYARGRPEMFWQSASGLSACRPEGPQDWE